MRKAYPLVGLTPSLLGLLFQQTRKIYADTAKPILAEIFKCSSEESALIP
jgi:hypothetical protein